MGHALPVHPLVLSRCFVWSAKPCLAQRNLIARGSIFYPQSVLENVTGHPPSGSVFGALRSVCTQISSSALSFCLSKAQHPNILSPGVSSCALTATQGETWSCHSSFSSLQSPYVMPGSVLSLKQHTVE